MDSAITNIDKITILTLANVNKTPVNSEFFHRFLMNLKKLKNLRQALQIYLWNRHTKRANISCVILIKFYEKNSIRNLYSIFYKRICINLQRIFSSSLLADFHKVPVNTERSEKECQCTKIASTSRCHFSFHFLLTSVLKEMPYSILRIS